MPINFSEYQQRRQRFMEKIGNGTAIIHSAPPATMHNDVEYVYRQESDFYYLTGFNEDHTVAVFAPHHPEHKFILFVQPKDLEKEIWTGYRAGIEGAKERYGADEAYPLGELDEKLPQYLEKADRLYYHFGRDDHFNQIILKHWQRLILTYPRRGTGPTAIADTNFVLHPLRMIKSAAELQMMQRAIDLSVEAHLQAQDIAKPGMYEYEIQAEMERIFYKNGGTIAYPSIVASGGNSCILHYIENNRKMEDGDLLLIDAGASYGYYNGDITRTFPINGKFTSEQKTLYDIVLKAQLAAIDQLKAGNPYNLYHEAAVKVIVEGLIDLGLLVGNIEEIIKEEKYKPFYMHRTGHWLGLDVHDVGSYKIGEETWHQLQAGQVLTVEPGIYISPYIKPVEGQPEIPDRWKGIGIRIEDDVLITDSGNEVLTAKVPK